MFDPKKWTIPQGIDDQVGKLRPTQLFHKARRQDDKHGRLQRPKCDVCKILMRIIRRQAHPARGPLYELQTFKCPTCAHCTDVSVSSPGGT
jgi:hypothetical protein